MREKFNIKPSARIVLTEHEGKIFLQAPMNKNYFDCIAGVLGLKGFMLKDLMEEKENELNN